jgi:hypothetical protein
MDTREYFVRSNDAELWNEPAAIPERAWVIFMHGYINQTMHKYMHKRGIYALINLHHFRQTARTISQALGAQEPEVILYISPTPNTPSGENPNKNFQLQVC